MHNIMVHIFCIDDSNDKESEWLLSLKQHFMGLTKSNSSINFEEFKNALNIREASLAIIMITY